MPYWILARNLLAIFLSTSVANCEVQSFRKPPSDTEVVLGKTAVLECHIANQVGSVQWSKDGTLLGFDFQVPGYARYEIVGNASLGIYNLKIVDAKFEDESEFQCQVGPAEGQEAIVAKAQLTVLSPPTSIKIINRSNGSKIQVKVSDSLKLVCEVSGGKPAPEVSWYKNSDLLPTTGEPDITTGDSGLKTVKSTLQITPTSDDNDVHYFCVASTRFSSEKLRTFIVLDVLYPPGRPIIEGYRTSDKLRSGDSVNIKCISRGGNPLARLVWTKNGVFIDHSYITNDLESVNEISFTATSVDDKAVYTCSAHSIMIQEPMEKSITLQVLYAPSSVSIKAPKEGKPGDVLSVTCKTDRSNPEAEITWVVDGRPIISESTVESDPNGGFITMSKISVNVTQQDRHSKLFTCYAVNQELGETKTQSHSVSILYAPDPPSIFGYVEGTPINNGKLQRLTCISHGGNPLPELKWYKGDKQLTGSEQSSGNIVSKELVLIVGAEDNSAQYHCKSSSKALSEPLVATVNLTVYFPPSIPSIKVKPKKPKAGSQVRLTCEISSSNPAANITWSISKNGMHKIIDATGIPVISAGENGGFSTKYTLAVNISAEDDGSKYICKATNEAIQQSSHDAVILSVLYKPIFNIPDLSEFQVEENCSKIINITATANPNTITYKCLRNNETVWESPIVNITTAERGYSGNYLCMAKNEVGESTLNFVIKVLYPMVIIRNSSESEESVVIAEPFSNVKLHCAADGYPFPKDAISWKRQDFNMAERTEVILNSNGKSILLIRNVTKETSGSFTCSAFNNIGSKDSWNIVLLVKHTPVIKEPETYNNILSDRGVIVELLCKAEGVPDVTFEWQRQGVKLPQKNLRMKTEITKLDHFVSKGVLIIQNVTTEDFDEYLCIAKNDIGFDKTVINLLPDSAPDPPKYVNTVNSTNDSILVVWVPGFDGGHNQSFRIRFRSTADPSSSYIDVHSDANNSMWIRGLKSNTEYNIAMMSWNDRGSSAFSTYKVKAKTKSIYGDEYKENDFEDISLGGSLVELLVGTIGTVFFILFIFNVILLALYYKKKKPKIKRRYSEETSSISESVTSKVDTDETTFSKIKSESRTSDHSLSDYSDSKSLSYSSTDEMENEEYSSSSNTLKVYPSSKFI